MRKKVVVFMMSSLMSFAALALDTAEIIDNRLKIQFDVPKDQSKGAFQLRSILEEHGFKNNDGFVRTGDALAPLELYNYLYEDGRLVFTTFLPFNSHAFMYYGKRVSNKYGFLSFKGKAAEKLFEIVKQHLPPIFKENLEQYRWGKDSYCDKTIREPAEYRCFIMQ